MKLKYLFPLLASIIFSSCSLVPQKPTMPTPTPAQVLPTSQVSPTMPPGKGPMVGLKTKYGQTVIKLYQESAPATVANFLEKAKSGFYRSLTFHRVEPGFVVQGGDPLGNGTGGGKITSEINNIPFRRGSIGLARGADKLVSNDSQFFICLTAESCQQLTNQYVNFGEVVSGMEFVDQIQVGDSILDILTNTK